MFPPSSRLTPPLHPYELLPLYRQVHLEAAATAGLTPHLCRLAREATLGGGDESTARLRQEQWLRFRSLVVPMLVGMVSCSSIARAKLWAAEGVDVFLLLLREQVGSVDGKGSFRLSL